jgi:hypothetical protein
LVVDSVGVAQAAAALLGNMGSALGPDIGRFFTLAFHGLKHGKADTHGQYLMIIHHCLEKVLRLPHLPTHTAFLSLVPKPAHAE